MSNRKKSKIGVVGGLGPYAGLDLVKKIFDNTSATCDQEHIEVILDSCPSIPDRTQFLEGIEKINPAESISDVISLLAGLQVGCIGIPCNTAHSPRIWNSILDRISDTNTGIKLVHMIDETAQHILERFSDHISVGLLCTTGTYKSKVYDETFEAKGLSIIKLEIEEHQRLIQTAIYSKEFGIKAFSSPTTKTARELLEQACSKLIDSGAEVIILGCTELPLVFQEREFRGVPFVDPTDVLARALIREVDSGKLTKVDL